MEIKFRISFFSFSFFFFFFFKPKIGSKPIKTATGRYSPTMYTWNNMYRFFSCGVKFDCVLGSTVAPRRNFCNTLCFSALLPTTMLWEKKKIISDIARCIIHTDPRNRHPAAVTETAVISV